jgi:hypothetical protein
MENAISLDAPKSFWAQIFLPIIFDESMSLGGDGVVRQSPAGRGVFSEVYNGAVSFVLVSLFPVEEQQYAR